MSLFKAITWWSTQCPNISNSYDSFSLHKTRLGFNESDKDYVIVGSHSGHLSIYQPSSRQAGDDGFMDTFAPTDVVLELKLNHPILGFSSGKFATGSKNENTICLAILHPMKVSVFTVVAADGIAEHGNQYKLQLMYEHSLTKFAFSLCLGNFGGVKGKEFLCVVHMDGTLKFFEQDGISYESLLPDERTIPFPVVYIPRIDGFVTMSPGGYVECFRYQDLSLLAEGKSVQSPVWSFFVGEAAIDIAVHQISNTESVILILGEQNIICLNDAGKLKFVKKLDYTPVCFHTFVIGWYWGTFDYLQRQKLLKTEITSPEPDTRLLVAVASDLGSLFIYEQTKLIWSAQLPQIPVALTRASFVGLSGAIVTLSENGIVNVAYLGSEPQIFKVSPLNLKELNIENTQKELAELESEIKSGIDFTDISFMNAAAERDLQIQLSINKIMMNSLYSDKINLPEDIPKMCQLVINFRSRSNLFQIQFNVFVEEPFQCLQQCHVFRDIVQDTQEKFDTWIYVNELMNVTNLHVCVLVSFISMQGIPRITEKKISLPLQLVFKSCSPQKEAKYKITLTAENVTNDLATIFPDFPIEPQNQVMGLKSIYTENIVTVVVAKNSNRFRLQSDHLTALTAILQTFLDRLQEQKNTDKNLKIVINPSFFIDNILSSIDKHFSLRDEMKNLMAEIKSKCSQMRLIERRLLVKIQDRTQGALGGVTTLLKSTHSDLLELAQQLKKIRSLLKSSRAELSNVLALTRNMVKFLNLPPNVTEGLDAVLVHPIDDWIDQFWEESVAPSLDMLNHIGHLKKSKNTELDDHVSFTTAPIDVARLKRHFKSLLERVSRLTSGTTGEHIVISEAANEGESSDWLDNEFQIQEPNVPSLSSSEN